MSAAPLRFGAFKQDPERLAVAARVQAWTRERFGLADEAAVLVTELACTRPGCPPLETVVAFWLDDEQRRHFKVFKPMEGVAPDDLPPAWLKEVLCAEPDDGFSCC